MKNNSYTSVQNRILAIWSNDEYISSLIKESEDTILYPTSEYIYKKYKEAEEFYRIYGEFKEDKAIEIIQGIFIKDEFVYVLCNLVNKEIEQCSILDQFYPVFKVSFKDVNKWLKLIRLNNFVSFYLFSLDGNEFLDISLLDDEKGCPHYNFSKKQSYGVITNSCQDFATEVEKENERVNEGRK